jgi:SAM-dependent methyltransferase
MSKRIVDTSTDSAWEEWGSRDPYFGVLTHPTFRRCAMTEEDRKTFFESGRQHVDYVMQTVRIHLDSNFVPESILDFGCGVGRTLVAFAQLTPEAVGLDISASMLQEASNNCQERGLSNVSLFRSDDALSAITRPFDLIHSSIVLQHIPAARGRLIFRSLLSRLAPRGIGAIHFLYAKSQHRETYGVAPAAIGPSPLFSLLRAKVPPPAPQSGNDPAIQMNPYNLNEILFLVQEAGAQRLYADFTDHGGELGLMIFFQMA